MGPPVQHSYVRSGRVLSFGLGAETMPIYPAGTAPWPRGLDLAGDEQRVQLVERHVERVGAPSNAGRNFTGSSAPSVLRTFFSGVFGGG